MLRWLSPAFALTVCLLPCFGCCVNRPLCGRGCGPTGLLTQVPTWPKCGGCGSCDACDSCAAPCAGVTPACKPGGCCATPCGGFGPFQWLYRQATCGSGCGNVYWGEWAADPPDCCDPCDWCGRFVGPRRGCRAWLVYGWLTLWGYRTHQPCGVSCCDAPVCGVEPPCGVEPGCGVVPTCGASPALGIAGRRFAPMPAGFLGGRIQRGACTACGTHGGATVVHDGAVIGSSTIVSEQIVPADSTIRAPGNSTIVQPRRGAPGRIPIPEPEVRSVLRSPGNPSTARLAP